MSCPFLFSFKDFDEATVQRLLRKGLGFSTTTASKEKDLVINVLSINSWVMHAQVADTFTNNHENVFLAGDAAHRFPPAGGISFHQMLFRCLQLLCIMMIFLVDKSNAAFLTKTIRNCRFQY